MKRVAGSLLAFGLLVTTAQGGVVSFGGSEFQVLPGEDLVLPVIVSSSDAASWNAMDIIIGSWDGLGLVWKGYDSGFLSFLDFPATVPGPFGLYPSDVLVGGVNTVVGQGGVGTTNSPWNQNNLPLLVGHVTIDTSGLSENPDHVYIIDVNPSYEEEIFGGQFSALTLDGGLQDELSGRASIRVVPEPATMGLLGLASLALIRRRKTA